MSKYFFNAKTMGVYIDGIHKIPKGSIEISDETYKEVFANAEPGKVIAVGSDGVPHLESAPPKSKEDIVREERAWRDAQIEQYRWMLERHRDEQDMDKETAISSAQFKELLTYIQELRDWPESKKFPQKTGRPVSPDWAAEQLKQ